MTTSKNTKHVTRRTIKGFRIFDHSRRLYVHSVTASGVKWTPNADEARMYRRHRAAWVVAGHTCRDFRIEHGERSYSRNIVAKPANPVIDSALAEWLNTGLVIRNVEVVES